MAVIDYPGKAEHYRSCLEIIANSGEARQGLRRYLETGSKGQQHETTERVKLISRTRGHQAKRYSRWFAQYRVSPLFPSLDLADRLRNTW